MPEQVKAAPRDEIAGRWREALLEVMERHIGRPILLSGGLDSATLLAGLLHLGDKPSCYSFRVGKNDSKDVMVARKMAKAYGLPFHLVEIPRNEDQLIADTREVIRLLKVSRKTSVQCSQPIMHMCRRIKKDGFDSAIVGTGAICLDDRTVETLRHTQGEQAARDYRIEKMGDKDNPECGTGCMHRMGRLCGTPLYEPYSENPLRDHALAMPMAELNSPKQKGIALRAFPDFWAHPWYRKNSSLQVNSGVREWHDTLLQSPVNKRGATRVVAIYNDLHKEIFG